MFQTLFGGRTRGAVEAIRSGREGGLNPRGARIRSVGGGTAGSSGSTETSGTGHDVLAEDGAFAVAATVRGAVVACFAGGHQVGQLGDDETVGVGKLSGGIACDPEGVISSGIELFGPIARSTVRSGIVESSCIPS